MMRYVLTVCLLLSARSLLAADPGYDPAPAKLVVMTWNVEWMFDHDQSDNKSDLSKQQSAPSAEYWKWKVAAVAKAIAASDATIVALQEIEGSQTLTDIANELREKHRQVFRTAFIQGSDSFTEQDVGILQRSGLNNFRRYEQSKTMFDSKQYYNLSKHLVAEFRWSDVPAPLTIINMHLRATAESETERSKQGRLARWWLQPQLDAGQDVIFLGDINSEHPVGELAGEMKYFIDGGEPAKPPRCIDLLGSAPENARQTHLILPKQFDRIIVSPSLTVDDPATRDWVFASIAVRPDLAIVGSGKDGDAHWDGRLTMPTSELDVSDHAPVIATFELK